MLWYKSFLETRWRFTIGLLLLVFSAIGAVMTYPRVMELVAAAPTGDVSSEVGRQIREGVELSREYRGYVWWQWFRQNLPQIWVFFAVLLASGSVLSQSSGAGTLFTLSLPASRRQLVAARALTGLAELLVMTFVPVLLLPLLSPAVGQRYAVVDALAHATCLFVAGAAFFSFAFLLSTMFSDLWRPLLIACGVAMVLAVCSQILPVMNRFSIFRVMNGETYFRGGGLPWAGLVVSLAVSAAFLYAAAQNLAHADF